MTAVRTWCIVLKFYVQVSYAVLPVKFTTAESQIWWIYIYR